MSSAIFTFDGNSAERAFPDYRGRLRRARLGLLVAITPMVMLFVSFTSAYIVRQGLPTFDESTSTYVRDWSPVRLPVSLFLVNTLLLLFSSITMELARRQLGRRTMLAPVRTIPGVSLGRERTLPWLGITTALGFGFLAGQWLAWRELAARGFYLATSPSSSFVYLLTMAHAVHLGGGLLALLWSCAVSIRVAGKRIAAANHRSALALGAPVDEAAHYIVVDITAWYWHFLALLWIYVFALLTVAK